MTHHDSKSRNHVDMYTYTYRKEECQKYCHRYQLVTHIYF